MSNLEKVMEGIGTPKADRVFCSRCGQELKDPASKARGMGPICFDKALEEGIEVTIEGLEGDDNVEGE